MSKFELSGWMKGGMIAIVSFLLLVGIVHLLFNSNVKLSDVGCSRISIPLEPNGLLCIHSGIELISYFSPFLGIFGWIILSFIVGAILGKILEEI